MVKKEVVDSNTIQILEHVADVMNLPTYQNTLVDFKFGDVVKCTILLGLYRVLGKSKENILLGKIDNTGPLYPIHAKYLKKVEINENTVDILYNGKNRGR